MLDPSPLLTDLSGGTEAYGSDQITVYEATYTPNSRGDWRQSDTNPVTYPAVVTRMASHESKQIQKKESRKDYNIMLYAAIDPGIAINQVVIWNDINGVDHAIKSEGDAIACGPGAYQFPGFEIDVVPMNTPQPESLTPQQAAMMRIREKMGER